MPSQERLNEMFSYRAGKLYWKNPIAKRVRKGIRAGRSRKYDGYCVVYIKQRQFMEHRIIWVMFHGTLPDEKVIDHIDRNRANNRLANLRIVTDAENAKNTGIYRSNTSGIKGVTLHKATGRWCIRINSAPYIRTYVGYAHTLEEAAQMRKDAEAKYGYL